MKIDFTQGKEKQKTMEGIKCGYFDMGNGPVEVVCLPQTGDVVIMDDICGTSYISELTVEDPIGYPGDESVLEKFGAKGVVITGKGLYIFREDGYYFADATDLRNEQYISQYDTSQCYDGEEIDYL